MSCLPSNLQPHEELLCQCALSFGEARARGGLEAIAGQPRMDWPAFVAQSIRHGTAQIAALQFANTADSLIPTDLRVCLERMTEANRLRNQVLFRETARLLRALQAQQLRCMILKGVALALTVYPDHALRNFADVDILVDAENFEAAGQVAETCGFEREAQKPHDRQMHQTYTAHCQEDILTDTLAMEFDASLTPERLAPHCHCVKVEIHRGLFRVPSGFLRPVDLTPFWENLQTASLPDGTPFCLLSPEAMLVHLCEHAADHSFRRLLFPLDVARVLAVWSERIDWNRVTMLAVQSGSSENMYRMLRFLRHEWGARIPISALRRLRPAKADDRALAPLTFAEILQTNRMDATYLIWQRLRQAKGGRDFLRVCGHLLFPPAPYMQAAYGVRSTVGLVAFYVYRPFHLAARLAQAAWRQVNGNRRETPCKGTRNV